MDPGGGPPRKRPSDGPTGTGVGGRTYRTPPGYEIVPWERLPAPERRRLSGAADVPDLYGILRPREDAAGLPPKALDRDTALLLLTLRDPGPLPRWARADEERIRELVLEGVLEVEEAGGFVSGARATSLLPDGRDGPAGGRLDALSRAALRHGAALPPDDVSEVARRLYRFGRLPLSPRWEERIPGPGAALSYLGVGPGGPGGWPQGTERDGGWLAWWRRPGGSGAGGEDVKLYVSPRPRSLPEVFPEIAAGLRAGGAAGFKVGCTAGNLLRPDRLVAYFSDRETLRRCASRLEEALAGTPAHGVPFTAPVADGALLSWGADPPSGGPGSGPPSWRAWVCRRLAGHLVEARGASLERRVAYARERMRADGVDPDDWRPPSTLWGRA